MGYLDIARKALADKKVEGHAKAHNTLARDALDSFFAQVIAPRIITLTRAGSPPDLAHDPLWLEMESEWGKAAEDSPVPCDVEKVKRLMEQVVEAHEKEKGQAGLFGSAE